MRKLSKIVGELLAKTSAGRPKKKGQMERKEKGLPFSGLDWDESKDRKYEETPGKRRNRPWPFT